MQLAALVEYAKENATETFLPVVLQLLASLLEVDRIALQNNIEGKCSIRRAASAYVVYMWKLLTSGDMVML